MMKVYKARLERMKLLMIKGIPTDIRWIIEARVRLTSEFSDSFISHLPGFGRSTYAKKRKPKECVFVINVCRHCIFAYKSI